MTQQKEGLHNCPCGKDHHIHDGNPYGDGRVLSILTSIFGGFLLCVGMAMSGILHIGVWHP